MRAIGETLAQRNSEQLVIAIANAMNHAAPEQRRALRSAYELYASAKILYDTNQPGAAIEGLQRASRAFAANRVPVLTSLTDVSVASTLFLLERYVDALDVATVALTRLEDASRYPSLVTRLEWVRALCYLALGRPHESLQSYEHALIAADRAGELDSVATLQNLRGEARAAIGDIDGALESRLDAMRTKSLVGGRNKTQQITAGVARSLFEQGHPEVALEIITAAQPRLGDRADFAAEVLLLRAAILHRLKRDGESQEALAAARQYALKSGDETINAAMLADIDAVLALHGSLTEPPRERLTRLTTALEHALATTNHYHQSRFLLQRARTFREIGDTDAAETDLRAAFSEVKSQRATIPGREERAIYFASARDVITDLIDLLLDGKRVEEAFDLTEEARAQGLLDPAVRDGAREALTHQQIIAALDRDTTLVSNVALPDRLVTWTVSRNGLRVFESGTGREALERLLLDDSDESRDPGRAIYDAVIAEVDSVPILRCVLIQDPILPPITLAVLKDRHGRYLVEKYPIAYSPSATAYVRPLPGESRGRQASGPRVFAAAASYFDSAVFENLLPLRAADLEVERIARVHRGASTAVGRDLTTERFLSGAADAEIVHFAGHAVGGAMATAAALVMAPDVGRGDPGVLYARTIAQHRFPHTRLVVLAACGVTSRADVDARAIGSIAYAFLAAGVPAVVATVRPVDDQLAATFTPRFHAALVERGDAAAALQAAQISLIRGSDPATRDPRLWGAFRLYGHYRNERFD